MSALLILALLAVLTPLPSHVSAQTQSGDATLSALTVSPRNIIGFAAATTSYQVGVASTVATATVAATPNHSGATAVITPADADTGTGAVGHQVRLSAGRNPVTVTVTAENGTTRTYTVSINRGVAGDYGWKASEDLDGLLAADNTSPFGIWSDGTTMWVADFFDDKIYAYKMSDKSRDPGKDFNTLFAAENRDPRGIWSDKTTMWVADTHDNKLYAYKMSDKSRDSAKDFTLTSNLEPSGIWSDRTTMWVADSADDKIYAYKMSDKSRDEAKEFNTLSAALNRGPSGIWSDETTMWVADFSDNKVYAYKMSDKSRDPGKEFNTLSGASFYAATGIWSDRDTMWVASGGDDKVYSYHMPSDASLIALTVNSKAIAGFTADLTTLYEVGVYSTVATPTVTVTPLQSDSTVAFQDTAGNAAADADLNAEGHQVNLSAGRNRLNVVVTARDGTTTRTYELSINRGVADVYGWRAGDDLDGLIAAENRSSTGLWSNETTMWVADIEDDKLYAYEMSDMSRDPGKDFDTLADASNGVPFGLWSDDTTMWVADNHDGKVYAYKMSDKSRDPGKDFPLAGGSNDDPTGIWSDRTTMWVADAFTDKLYAYKMSDKSRDPGKDFTHAGDDPRGIWSDETTMWVVDKTDGKVYAYRMSDKSRDPGKDFDTLAGAGNDGPTGIWSDHTTMWVADGSDEKVYSYNHPIYVTSAVVDGTSLTLTFNRDLAAAGNPGNSAFTVKKTPGGGAEAPVALTGSPAISDTTVTLTLAAAVTGADTDVKVSYAKPTSGSNNKLVDTNSVEVDGFTDQRVVQRDATLRALTVNSNSVHGFSPGLTSYQAGVASTVATATVAATPNHLAATVVITPTDVDAVTVGHQVSLSHGRNAVTATVTAEDGTTTTTYTLSVNRGVADDYGWRAADDLDGLIGAGSTDPYGIWSNGTTMWVVDRGSARVYAYNMSNKSRDEAKDFTLAATNNDPWGIWSNGETIWVADASTDKLYAYKMSDKSRDADKDFDTLAVAGNEAPGGIWSDRTTMWVADSGDDKIYAYKMSDMSRDPAKDFNTLSAAENKDPSGIWSDRTTMWVADFSDNKVYAYKMSDMSRNPGKDFNTLSGVVSYVSTGIWSDDDTMWVASDGDDKVYSYNMPVDASLSTLTVSPRDIIGFTPARTSYDVGLFSTVAGATVTATVRQSGSTMAFQDTGGTAVADADLNAEGHQLNLAAGRNRLNVLVTARDGTTTRTYELSINRGVTDEYGWRAGDDLDGLIAAGNNHPIAVWSNDTTMWVADSTDDKIYAYKKSDKSRDEAKDFDTLFAAGNNDPWGIWSNDTTMWVADNDDNTLYAYKMSDKSRDDAKDFATLDPDNDDPHGIWSDRTTMWVADADSRTLYAYKMSDKSRDSAKDFATLDPDNRSPTGIWSDGETMWVGDLLDDNLFAYKMSDKSRDSAKDFATLDAAANHFPAGIWSDGETMWIAENFWVARNFDGKVFSYNMPADASLRALTVDSNSVHGFSPDRTSYEVGVFSTVAAPTVTATPVQSASTVEFQDTAGNAVADADPNAEGHQVSLTAGVHPLAGRTRLNVVVTALDGTTTKTYELRINRGVAEDYGWRAGDDLDGLIAAGSTDPHGIWSNGETIWVADRGDAKIYAYKMSDKSRDPANDFDTLSGAGNNNPEGIWSNGETMWVVDYVDKRLYAYKMSDKSRDSAKDFGALSLPSGYSPSGIWSDRETMWVSVSHSGYGGESRLFAYKMSDKSRDSAKDFNNGIPSVPSDIWSDGQTMWVVDFGADRLYAFKMSNKGADSSKNYTLGSTGRSRREGGDFPRGIWSDGTTMWVSDDYANKVFSYNHPDIDVTVSFEAAAYTVTEGNTATATVTVSLDTDPGRTVVVPLTTTNQGTASDSDYTGVPSSVTFNAGETSKTFTVAAVDDKDDDNGESVTLGFGTLPNAVTAATPESTTVSITDDDLTVSFGSATYTVAEGANVTVTVTLSEGSLRPMAIPVILTGEDGATDDDFEGAPSRILSFAANDTSKSFTFTATDDDVDDDGESVKLEFLAGALPAWVTAAAPKSATISITDDDAPTTVEASFGDATYSVTEGGSVTVTVNLSDDPERTVVIPLAAVDGVGGASASDYASLPASVTFNAGDTSQTFAFSAVADSLREPGEAATIGFGTLPATATAGSPATTSVTILDAALPPSPPTIHFGEAAYTAAEGGSATVTVTLSKAPGSDAVVPLTKTDQGGITPADYSGVPGSVTFAATETSKSFTFTAVDDLVDDDGESVLIGFGALPGGITATAGQAAETTVSIADDDRPATLSVSFGSATYSVAEGGFVDVVVTLDEDPEQTVVIPLTTTNQGGASDVDYDTIVTSVTFVSGETSKSFRFSARRDRNLEEVGESVRIAFGTLPDDVSAGATGHTTVSITEPIEVSIGLSSISVNVREGGSVSYTVRLGAQPDRLTTLTISGQAGTDLTLDKESLTFTRSNWATPQTVTVTAGQDGDTDTDIVNLLHAIDSGNATDRLTVIVFDNDTGIVLSTGSISVDEGDTAGVSYTAKLARAPTGDVTVAISGQVNTDLTLDKESLTFTTENWNTPQTVTVTAGQDDDSLDESVLLLHRGSGGGFIALVDVTDLAVTVKDDDEVSIVLSTDSLLVEEAHALGGLYTVRLSHRPTGTVTVTISGHSGTRLRLDRESLTFSPGNWDSTQQVAVTYTGDGNPFDSSATLTHVASGGEYEGVSADLAVTVQDIDTASIVLSKTSLSVSEGSSTGDFYTVKLSHQPLGDVTVAISGQAGTDLTLNESSLTFTTLNWDTTQTVTVTAAEDSDPLDESATLAHAASGGGYDAVSADLPVTVGDDDPGIVLSATSLRVIEGNPAGASYTVKLAHQPTEDVTVTYEEFRDPDQTPDSGLTSDIGEDGLTFTAANWNIPQTVTVTAADDVDPFDDSTIFIHEADGSGFSAIKSLLNVRVEDDETASIVLSQTSLSLSEGDTSGVAYTVKLSHQPLGDVTVAISGQAGTDLTLDVASLTFTTENWDTTQTVTVTAADDSDPLDDSVTLSHAASGGGYDAVSADLPVTVGDGDPGIVLSATSLTVIEGDTAGASYTVKLAHQPTEDVTVTYEEFRDPDQTPDSGVTSDIGEDGLTFTAANWNIPQTVTVTAADDVDPFDDSTIFIHEADGSGFSSIKSLLNVKVNDDETASIVLNPTSLTAPEGDTSGVTYTVKLSHQPKAGVTVAISGQAGTDLTLDVASLTFTTENWDTTQTVTVTAGSDADFLDDSVTLSHTATGGGYSSVTADLAVTIEDLAVKVSFGAATYTAAEGGTATVTVTLNKAPERTVVIPLTKMDQGGASSSDYSGVPASVTFNAADTSKTFTFTAADDTVDDDGESVKLTFATLPAGVSAGSTSSTTVSITDDDAPASVAASFGSATYSVTEGSTVTVTVTVSDDPERTVVIPLTATSGGGASASDYSGVPASVTFNAGDTSKSFTLSATADQLVETGESVAIGFGMLPSAATAGSPATATVSIADDTQTATVPPTVHFGESAYTAAEGGSVTVTVTLSKAPGSEAVIPLTKTDQGGADAADYSGVPSTVTFAAADTSKTFTFTAADDSVDDDGESVKLAFGTLPGGITATTGQAAEATVSITDDDDPAVTVSFGAATYTAAEGGTATVTVTLSAAPERSVVIPLTKMDQGGASSSDYSGVPTSVTFGAADTSKTFTFTAADDTVDDDGESVKLTFATLPAGVSAGSTSSTTVSITDDDAPTSVAASFGEATYSVTEGSSVTVTVTLSDDPERTVVIPLTATNRGGASGSDYSGAPASVTFNAGDTSKSFTLSATADQLVETGESVAIGFGRLPTAATAGSPATATVSIADDTQAATVPPTVHFGESAYTAAEGGSVSVTVTLSKAPGSDAVVPLTKTDQGGADAADYSGVPSTVTFAAADTSKTFTFTAADDSVDDDGESVKLAFGTLPGGITATTGQAAEATVSITDDDDPAVTVSFGAATYTAAEGGTTTVTVTLSAAPERTVVIPLTKTDQGGASGSDYSGVPASVTFGAADTSKTFTFTAADDSEDDDGESVKLAFGNLPAGVSAGSTSTTTVSITDDDAPTSVAASFGEATYSVTEGSTVTVTVTVSDDPERTVVIPLTATNGGGANASDYSGVPASVTFNAGDTSKTFTLTATADQLVETGESVSIGFGRLPSAATAGTPATATVSIADDTQTATVPPTVHFGESAYTAAEGGSVTVTVTLSKAPGSDAVIPLTKTDQGGADAADYSGVPSTVTFAAADTSKTFTFTAADDSVDDDGESVKLAFGTLPGGITATTGEAGEATVSITDDDDPAVTVSFGSATYTAAEGGTTTVTVTLSAAPERTVVIPLTKLGQGGASSSDYSGVPASLSFGAAERSKTFTFTATGDTVDDDGESVKLAFGNLPAGVSAGSTSTTTVSITDDDAPTSVAASFGEATYSVTEGSSVTVTVTLSDDPERTVVIPLTATNRGGASGSDYSGVPASVTFNAGDTSKSFTLTATADQLVETGESVAIGFGRLPSAATAGTPATATVSIGDDTQTATVPPTVHFGESAYTAAEGGSVTVTVTLSKAPGSDAVIPLTKTDQGGADAADYSGVPSSLSFAAADTSKTFTFTAADDSVDDDGESVKLAFGTLPGGITATSGEADEATVSITDDDDPAVKVSFGAATYTTAEGGTTTVTVTLSAAPERMVVIPLTKLGQGGAGSSDYSGVPASVTFGAADTSKTFTFTAADDTVDDDGESVKLGFGILPAEVSAGSTSSTTVSITDDDDPAVTVSYGEATYTVAEGGTATVTVTLSAAPERSVVIPLTKLDQGGASSSDYSGVPASVTFNAADTSKSFTFTATGDTVDDDGESVKLAFGNLPAGVSAGATATSTVSITDDDDPAVTVSFGSATYTAAEGGTVTVTVTLSAAPERMVVIPLTKLGQGGAGSSDYSGVPASVTFAAADTSKTFTFTAADDTVDDDGESVKLGFGNLPTGVSAGSTSSTTVSITDDDDPAVTVSFGAATYTAAEGGTATVTVTLSAAPERMVVIPLTKLGQGGASGSDYSGVPASVTFNAADTSKSFTFTATGDTVDDDGESVKLAFGILPTGVTAGATATSTVSITDDDDPAVTVSFGSATYTAAEGGTATVTVTLSAAPERSVVIPLTKRDQGGASGSDYSGVPASVTFNAADTSKSFTFTATGDTVDDDGESVKLAFGILPTGVTAGATATSTVSITDDDDPAVKVSFGAATYTAAEGGTATVTVTLSAAPERSVVIPLTKLDQGGASSSDYSGVPASVTFNAADTSKSFTFTATGDTVDDDGESVKLAFGILPTGVTAGATATSTVSITDDDDPAVTVSFGEATYTVAEGGTVTVTVTLSAAPERTVVIPLTKTGQGGASSSDYSGMPASVTFNAADTSKSFTFTATGDTVDDDGESVKLAFGILPTGVTAGATATSTVSITDDDDPAVTVSFGSATYTAAEGANVTVTVTLSAVPERSVVIPLTKADQGGATNSDYSGVPASVTFGAADTSKTFTFTAADDTVDDDGESVKLAFGNLPTGVSAGSTSTTTVSITDDDDPAVTVSFGSATYTAAEGGTTTVTVTLSAAPERTVVIPLTKMDQGGATSSDYSGVPASVTFNAADTSKTFTFTATGDTVDDDGESVKLGFGILPTGVTAGSTSSTTVSITDDDDPAVTVSFGSATYTAAEGGTATVTVTLSAAPERTVVIPLTKLDQGGATSSDYSGVPASVSFGAADTTKTFTFTATGDTVDDDGESVKLAFGNLPTGVSAGSTSSTTVSITDDDDPAVTVSFGAATYTAAEGGTVTVTVTLSAAPERMVVIPLTKLGQGGAGSSDYSGVPASVTFNAADTSKTFTFTATDDSVDDDGESVKLTFATLPTGVSAGSTSSTTVSITDDDDPAVTVSYGEATYTVAEGGTVTVTVTLSAAPERMVVIPLTKLGQGGASSSDYSGVPASVTFGAADTSKTFTFTAADDTVDDDGESVKLAFGILPTGVTAGATATSTVSITDDDDPAVTVSFGSATYTAAEGGTATVTVTLSAAPERSVVIPLTKRDQGGASGSDYSGVPASVTFNAADTSKSFTFTATGDTVDDDGESVKLAFGNLPTGVTAGATATSTVSITDDDDPAVTVSYGEATYTVAEGANVTVTVTLSAAPERMVVIPLTKLGQGGASGSDYSGVPASVTFAAADTSKTFTFTATGDTVDDDGESVKLGFGILPTGVTAGSTSSTTVSITDDDDPAVTVSFGSATYTAAEGGTATVTVTLSAAPERTVVIPLTKLDQGGATSSDYSGVPASVTFNAADTSKSFTFTATGDAVDDDGESVRLAFGILPTGVTAGATATSTVSITDDDDPAVTVSFGSATYTAAEGGTATVTVTLSAAPERTVVIPLTKADQGGATSSDYSGVPASVTFGAADTSKTFTFTAADDTVDDDGESVKLAFGNLPAGVSAGSTSTTTVSITDDDAPTTVAGCVTGAISCHDVEFDSTERSGPNYLNITSAPSTWELERFEHNGVVYRLNETWMSSWSHETSGIRPPFRIPERAKLKITLEAVSGDCVPAPEWIGSPTGCVPWELPNDDYLDWALHVSTVKDGETLTVELPFSEANHGESPSWKWHGSDLDDLLSAWSEGQSYRYQIVSDPRADRTPQVPGPPLYLRTYIEHPGLWVYWVASMARDGKSPLDVRYKVQWKLSTGDWDTPADVSEKTDNISGGRGRLMEIGELTAGLEYNIRVIAVNSAGASPASNVITYTPSRSSAQSAPGNFEATGAPTINGTPRAGEALTAITTGIEDADGLERATFSYQWLVGGVAIGGATGSGYTPLDEDVGKAVKVTVSFTDDAGYEESLTSEATEAVQAGAGLTVDGAAVDGVALTLTFNEILDQTRGGVPPASAFTVNVGSDTRAVSGVSVLGYTVTLTLESAVSSGDTVTVDYVGREGPAFIRDTRGRVAGPFTGQPVTNDTAAASLTAGAHSVPASHDGSATFTFELRFSETPGDGFSYKTLRDHSFTSTGGEVVNARRLEQGRNVRWEITVQPDGNGDVTVVLPATTDCTATGAICTGDGRKLSNELTVTVADR